MNAFERGNLATAERELRKCVAHLKTALRENSDVPGVRAVDEARALISAEWALEEIDRTVRISEIAA